MHIFKSFYAKSYHEGYSKMRYPWRIKGMNKLFTPEDVTICDSLKQGLNDKTASSLGQLNNESLSSLGQLNRTRTAPPKATAEG